MRIKQLRAVNFRSLKNLDLVFDRDFIIFTGLNGSGKTSVLEALYYASVLQAFPPGKTWELIDFGSDFFRIELGLGMDKNAYYYGRKGEKKYERAQSINGVRKNSGQILGGLPSVSFLPADLNMLVLAPSLRREYLDEILLQTKKNYEGTLREYARVVNQRNELLDRVRKREAGLEELFFWDDKIAGLAVNIVLARHDLVDFINERFVEIYKRQSGVGQVNYKVRYTNTSQALEKENFIQQLKNNREADIATARTNIGPHRDDWKLVDPDNRDLARYLSRGEQRGLIIALKVVEAVYLEGELGKKPIILLDELLAELDQQRRQRILRDLPPENQKFLTAISLEEVPQELSSGAQVFDLNLLMSDV